MCKNKDDLFFENLNTVQAYPDLDIVNVEESKSYEKVRDPNQKDHSSPC
jgi:hypothetical protein